MKKFISIVLACALVICSIFALTGCAKNDESFELVLITDGGSVNDGGFNESAWNGIKSYGDANKMDCRYYQPNTNEDGSIDDSVIKNYIELAANNGAKYIVLPGEEFAVAAYEYAPTYKDINFILIDSVAKSTDDDGETVDHYLDNVMTVKFDKTQAGFLAGYVSVLEGNRKLGYFGSSSEQSSADYGVGFAQGAAYCADQLGVPVTLDYANYDSDQLDYDYSFTIEPEYIDVSESTSDTYKVNVVNGVGSGVYADGENVTITANAPEEGKIFDHWEVKSDTEGVKDKKVNISSKKKSTINLIVDDCDCTITAVYADTQTVPVTVVEADGVTTYEAIYAPVNSSAWVEAPAATSGMVFDHWEINDESLLQNEDDIYSSGISINVKETAVTLVPVYVESEAPTFDVVVKNGTGSGSYVAGDTVSIVADAPEDGKMFNRWVSVDSQGLKTGISMDNEYCYTTTFEMVDRFASVSEKMYDDGVTLVFAGGNNKFESVFTAINSFDYTLYSFGAGVDQSSYGNCLASVVSDYGTAIELALDSYEGGTVFTADCSNKCIYVTGKNIDEYQLNDDGTLAKDKKGNTIKNNDYNADYSDVYNALAEGKISVVNAEKNSDITTKVTSDCLTINYWVVDNSQNAEVVVDGAND